MSEVLSAQQITKVFVDGDRRLEVLKDVSFSVAEGERVFIFGRSGSGKSTLLHILAGLDDPSDGEVQVAGNPLSGMNAQERAQFRNQVMGFVYQFHHLLPEFSALENVAMPLLIRGESRRIALEKSLDLLKAVELADRESHLPKQLSGGERLRVAVARSIVGEPQIVFADEPTGSLDSKSAEHVMQLLVKLSEEHGSALVVVTHDEDSKLYATRTLHLVEGSIE